MNSSITIKLKSRERSYLRKLVRSGRESARKIRRAHILLQRDRNVRPGHIAEAFSVCYNTVYLILKRYRLQGLDAALKERPRRGRPLTFDERQRAKITALACTKAPDGRSRWSLRLLADYVVELGIVDSISHTEVGRILKKTSLSLI